jgi:hypothetical protein
MTDTVCTLYELMSGDDTVQQGTTIFFCMCNNNNIVLVEVLLFRLVIKAFSAYQMYISQFHLRSTRSAGECTCC